VTREELVALLAAHEPADPGEAADLERMRGWAGTLAQPFAREQPEAHFTASAIVVDDAGERTLLVHHRKSEQLVPARRPLRARRRLWRRRGAPRGP